MGCLQIYRVRWRNERKPICLGDAEEANLIQSILPTRGNDTLPGAMRRCDDLDSALRGMIAGSAGRIHSPASSGTDERSSVFHEISIRCIASSLD